VRRERTVSEFTSSRTESRANGGGDYADHTGPRPRYWARRLSAGGVEDEWVTQLLRLGDPKVFKQYALQVFVSSQPQTISPDLSVSDRTTDAVLHVLCDSVDCSLWLSPFVAIALTVAEPPPAIATPRVFPSVWPEVVVSVSTSFNSARPEIVASAGSSLSS
jgi:hypothetical protein